MRGVVLAITVLMTVAVPAWSQSPEDRAEARKYADAGLQAFQEGQYDQAIEDLSRAEKLVHAPPHLLYIARALEQSKRLGEARATYRAVVDETLGPDVPEAFHRAKDEARKELAALEARLPRIAIVVALDAPFTATVDGVRAGNEPFVVLPGAHVVEVTAEGYAPWRKEVTAEVGTTTVDVDLVEEGLDDRDDVVEPASPSKTPIGPILVMGAGLVGLVLGGVTGGLALGKAGELKDKCPENPCPPENEELKDDAERLAVISTVGFVVGGLAVAGGVTWLVIELMGGDAEGEAFAPFVGPGHAGIRGRF